MIRIKIERLRSGILVFQTGQNEISTLCKKLRKRFPLTPSTKSRYSNELEQEEEMSLSETLEGIREKLTARNGMTIAFESLRLLDLFIYDKLECHSS